MAAPQKLKPSVAGIWIGIVLILLGLGSCVGGPVASVWGLVDSINDSPVSDRVQVPDSYVFEAQGDASGVVVAFGPSGSSPDTVSATLSSEDGEVIRLDGSMEVVTTTGDEALAVLGTFDNLRDGTYVLETSGDAQYEVAVLNVDLNATLLVASVGIGLLLMLIGFILLIVTMVRRSKAKKARQTAQYLPPTSGGYGAPAGAPGYGPPGYGAPGYGTPPAPGGAVPPPAPPAPAAPGSYAPPPAPPAPGSYAPPPAPPASAVPPAPPAPPAPAGPGAEVGGDQPTQPGDQPAPPPPPWGNS